MRLFGYAIPQSTPTQYCELQGDTLVTYAYAAMRRHQQDFPLCTVPFTAASTKRGNLQRIWLYQQQDRRCVLCPASKRRRRPLWHFHLDHCHQTGLTRALLCPSCNARLGFGEQGRKPLTPAMQRYRDTWVRAHTTYQQATAEVVPPSPLPDM